MENETKLFHMVIDGGATRDLTIYEVAEYILHENWIKTGLFGDAEKHAEIERRLQERFKDAETISGNDIAEFYADNFRLFCAHLVPCAKKDNSVYYVIKNLDAYWDADWNCFTDLFEYATRFFDEDSARKAYKRALKFM